MHAIPTLTTDRLILHPPGAEHFEAALRLWTDPQVARFTGGSPRPADDIWTRLVKKAGNWALFGYGDWMVERRSDGVVLGQAGFMLNVRLMDPAPAAGWPNDPEIGWAFLPEAQGQGLASEAVAACLAWGDALPMRRTICVIEEGNTASMRLAERHGYTPYDRGGLGGRPAVLLERFAA